ncbi:MAG: signal peptide peptidase SppA [Deltaproteobacteria bacterium]|nr:signal peptide peptidase SppA [Deltaproteobacteria bacterium]MBW2322053.1 signal peptide peptidase SppA [Deltaproteobacteria bacterium]
MTLFVIVGVIVILAGVLVGAAYFFGDVGDKSFGDGIGVVEIKGIITSSEQTLKTLNLFRHDKRIKAIILRIDSPGGGVAATQEIYREVMKFRQNKKVIASLGSLAASGGIYIASAADQILANPGTLTGSVAVIFQFANYQELFDKVGLKTVVIKSGEFKDIGSPTREMTAKEKKILERLVKQIHQQFINDLAKARGLPVEKVAALADGRIFTGEEAVSLGLVDSLGNFEDAVALAQKMSGLKTRPKLVYPKRKKSWIWDLLTNEGKAKLLPDWFGFPFQLQYRYAPGF